MSRYARRIVITDRDRRIFGEVFENRVMCREQIFASTFQGVSRQAALNRLTKLTKYDFFERQYAIGRQGRVLAAFSTTPKALREIANTYRHKITSEYCKSDSVQHDLILNDVRARLKRLKVITRYLTENMLQACAEFSEVESLWPFVQNNTDAVLEITRQSAKTFVALEFENSEKAQERYVRKLVNYYSDARTPAIFYVCSLARIRNAVMQAEASVGGNSSPRCFYALLPDVLSESPSCTFTDRNGAKITLS